LKKRKKYKFHRIYKKYANSIKYNELDANSPFMAFKKKNKKTYESRDNGKTQP
jgi:hypothetical protein